MIQLVQSLKEAVLICQRSFTMDRNDIFFRSVSRELKSLEDRLSSVPGAVVTICNGIPIAVMQEQHGLQIFMNGRREPAAIIDVFEGVVKVCCFSSDADEAKVVVELDNNGVIENVEMP